jgi:hypothetical protein
MYDKMYRISISLHGGCRASVSEAVIIKETDKTYKIEGRINRDNIRKVEIGCMLEGLMISQRLFYTTKEEDIEEYKRRLNEYAFRELSKQLEKAQDGLDWLADVEYKYRAVDEGTDYE